MEFLIKPEISEPKISDYIRIDKNSQSLETFYSKFTTDKYTTDLANTPIGGFEVSFISTNGERWTVDSIRATLDSPENQLISCSPYFKKPSSNGYTLDDIKENFHIKIVCLNDK